MKLLVLLLISTFTYGADICLTLIVKNDEAVIEQCLKSVEKIVDCIAVCDAGSTDRSIEIATTFLKKTGIPGKVYFNAGKNRVAAVVSSKELLRSNGYNLSETYLLILDADRIVRLDDSFNKDSLSKDGYLLLENSSPFYTYNLNLVRASSSSENPPEKLRTLLIEDLGNHKKRVQEALQKKPDNGKEMFYLAESLMVLKEYDTAIFWFKKRLDLGGDRDEVWFSKYMIGECYKELGNWETALFWLLDAYHADPDRTAPLLSIAMYYRLRGKNALAYIFASYGSRIPGDDRQMFFNAPPDAAYRFDEESSIVAYYTRFREEGFAAADKLLLTKGVPWHVKNQTYRNLEFYVQTLPHRLFMPVEIDLPLIDEGVEERYHPMNPSIIKTSDGYKMICRSVNYTQTGAKFYQTNDKKGIFRTKNFLIHYDKHFNLIAQNELVENLPRERVRSWISDNTKGLDDCRIFEFKGRIWFTCTTSDTNPTGNYQISACRLAQDEKEGVDKLIPLLGPDPHRCEKNWAPCVIDDELMLIYSYDPFVVYQPNLITGRCEKVVNYKPHHDLSSFRGSASPIIFDEGYLILIHEVSHMDDYTRKYFHRFVYLTQDFVVQKISRPFIFKHSGIEFCCGMTINHDEDELIIGVGIEDREAYLCFTSLNTIRSLLYPLTP